MGSLVNTGFSICSICALTKPIESFPLRKDTGKRRSLCQACRNSQSQKWVVANLQKRRAIALKWAKNNYAYIRKKKAEYRALRPLAMRRWSIENPEKMDALRKDWDRRNPHRKLQHARNRQARKRRAIPIWANQDAMNQIYLEARIKGPSFEVDHVIPLKGKTVCGLHWEGNLEIITRRDNRVKGCFRWPDMP